MKVILMIPVLLFSIICHECAHGYTAYLCGDDTAKRAGRLTLNPLPHIDLFGSILFPLVLIITRSPFLIGWAKPVPVNPSRLRQPDRHHLYVSLSGIAVNLMLAVCFTVIYGLYGTYITGSPEGAVGIMLQYGIIINVVLAVFNVLPVPPLDGSWILYHLLPRDLAEAYYRLFPYGFVILILLLMTNILHMIMMPIFSFIMSFLDALLRLFS